MFDKKIDKTSQDYHGIIQTRVRPLAQEEGESWDVRKRLRLRFILQQLIDYTDEEHCFPLASIPFDPK